MKKRVCGSSEGEGGKHNSFTQGTALLGGHRGAEVGREKITNARYKLHKGLAGRICPKWKEQGVREFCGKASQGASVRGRRRGRRSIR